MAISSRLQSFFSALNAMPIKYTTWLGFLPFFFPLSKTVHSTLLCDCNCAKCLLLGSTYSFNSVGVGMLLQIANPTCTIRYCYVWKFLYGWCLVCFSLHSAVCCWPLEEICLSSLVIKQCESSEDYLKHMIGVESSLLFC